MIRRRSLGAAATALAAPAAGAAEEALPNRPLRLVVPFAPGGPTDLVARVLAERLRGPLGQPVLVENRPGANGNLAAEGVARAGADGGHTVLYNTSSIALSAALQPGLPYDVLRDFAPVALTAVIPMVLVVHPALPANDLAGFVALLRREGAERFSYGSGGVGNITRLAALLFLRANGLEAAVHVPYRGSAPAMADLMAGQVQFMTDALNTPLPLIRDGRLRALAVASPTRSPALAEVPTFAEAGAPGFEIGAWQGMLAPTRTPPAAIARLNAAVNAALADPDLRATLVRQTAEPLGGTPEAYAAHLRAEVERWRRIGAQTGLRLE